jgi:hypothetical protein
MNHRHNQTVHVHGMSIHLSYDIWNESRINYLLDYSKFLIKNKIYDRQLIKWQSQNIEMLRSLLQEEITLSKVYIF